MLPTKIPSAHWSRNYQTKQAPSCTGNHSAADYILNAKTTDGIHVPQSDNYRRSPSSIDIQLAAMYRPFQHRN